MNDSQESNELEKQVHLLKLQLAEIIAISDKLVLENENELQKSISTITLRWKKNIFLGIFENIAAIEVGTVGFFLQYLLQKTHKRYNNFLDALPIVISYNAYLHFAHTFEQLVMYAQTLLKQPIIYPEQFTFTAQLIYLKTEFESGINELDKQTKIDNEQLISLYNEKFKLKYDIDNILKNPQDKKIVTVIESIPKRKVYRIADYCECFENGYNCPRSHNNYTVKEYLVEKEIQKESYKLTDKQEELLGDLKIKFMKVKQEINAIDKEIKDKNLLKEELISYRHLVNEIIKNLVIMVQDGKITENIQHLIITDETFEELLKLYLKAANSEVGLENINITVLEIIIRILPNNIIRFLETIKNNNNDEVFCTFFLGVIKHLFETATSSPYHRYLILNVIFTFNNQLPMHSLETYCAGALNLPIDGFRDFLDSSKIANLKSLFQKCIEVRGAQHHINNIINILGSEIPGKKKIAILIKYENLINELDKNHKIAKVNAHEKNEFVKNKQQIIKINNEAKQKKNLEILAKRIENVDIVVQENEQLKKAIAKNAIPHAQTLQFYNILKELNVENPNYHVLKNLNIKELNELFLIILDLATTIPRMHKNKFVLLGKCREQALIQLKQVVNKENDRHSQVKLFEENKALPLFALHRNQGFFATIGRTNTVITIDAEIQKIKEKCIIYTYLRH